jgi:hypothetical protein
VDVTETAREAGFRVPVAPTQTAWADCVCWAEEDSARVVVHQDESGRLWDMLWMARLPMSEKMDRVQLLLAPELKVEIQRFADARGISLNEAIRVLCRRGLNASEKAEPVSALVEELGHRVRDLEQRLAGYEGTGT